MEEYRQPEFEVTLQADRANIVNGDRVNLTVEAKTYFGAPLPDAPIMLNQLTRSYEAWWYDAESFDTWSALQKEEPVGHADADGRWSGWIDLKVPDYLFREYYSSRHAVPVLLEVMVNDGNGQAIGAQARVTVHDAAYWNPRLVTDEQGRAVAKVTLPDSLTRWRAVARAVTRRRISARGRSHRQDHDDAADCHPPDAATPVGAGRSGADLGHRAQQHRS